MLGWITVMLGWITVMLCWTAVMLCWPTALPSWPAPLISWTAVMPWWSGVVRSWTIAGPIVFSIVLGELQLVGRVNCGVWLQGVVAVPCEPGQLV